MTKHHLCKTWFAAVVLAFSFFAVAGTAAAGWSVPAERDVIPNDGGGAACTVEGSQGSQTYDVYACTSDAVEEPIYYQTVEGSANPCRSHRYTVSGKNVFGMTLWKYRQRVFWCWNGATVTYVYRERYAVCCFPIWDFKGHTDSNCSSEHCGEKRGGSSAYIVTQGKFEACAVYIWACQRVYPRIWHIVRNNGSVSAGSA